MLDDIGYVQHDQDEMEVLFAVLSERSERERVGISTNLVCSDWVRIFKSPLTMMAAIDRMVHHAVILDLQPVASYRAQTAVTQQERQRPPTGRRPNRPSQPIPVTSAARPRIHRDEVALEVRGGDGYPANLIGVTGSASGSVGLVVAS